MAQRKKEGHGGTWRVPPNPTPQQYEALVRELNYYRDMYQHLSGVSDLVVMQLEYISSQAAAYSQKLTGAKKWCETLKPPAKKG